MRVQTIDREPSLRDLLAEEIALKDHIERVAAMRRKLGPGPAVKEDYVFREGPADLARNAPADFREVRLSQLFAQGKDGLLIYHYMYAPDDDEPCPMCTMWSDGYNAVAPHVADRANFVLVAKADIAKFRNWARRRGWNNIRLLSSHDSTFNRDFGAEDDDGDQLPGISVFTRDPDGTIRHYYTKHAELDDNNNRGIDLLSPVWNLFDLLPSGRGDWLPKFDYRAHARE